MAKSASKPAKKIIFSRSRDIPFNKLVLSASNVRRIRPDHNVEELAEDIARREDLVQGLNVRPVLDPDGNETGMLEVPAGGRRYRAIERFVKAKRFPKDGLVTCIVRDPSTKILAEDDWVASTLLGERPMLKPEDVFAALQGRTDLDLAQGLKLQRVRVMGAHRIELSDFSDTMRDRLRAYGLFTEIISWKLRMFVPTGASGVLAKVPERHPVERIGEREAA